jgi:phosphoglycerate-specific signal transduction histidine kinase
MTIRLIARELYRLRQQVETIEKEIEAAPSDKRADLERSLQQARAELQQMQKILDGRIDRRS